MKPPFYLNIETSYKPTDLDKNGCDGLYIKSVKCKDLFLPIILPYILLKILKEKMKGLIYGY